MGLTSSPTYATKNPKLKGRRVLLIVSDICSKVSESERCGFQVGKGTEYKNIELSNTFYICPSHPIASLDRVA